MSKLFEVLPLKPRPTPEKPPAEAFEAMEEEAATVDEPLTPILPCEKPRVEVWLTDGDGVAIKDVDLSLLLGGKHDGRLDAQGYLKFEDVQVPDAPEVVAELTTTDDGRHHLQLREGPAPKEDAEDAEDPEELTEEPEPYQKPELEAY